MKVWKFIDKKFESLEKNVPAYEEMIKTGDELKAKGEKYSVKTYKNAKKRIKFYKEMKKLLPDRKVNDNIQKGMGEWLRQYFVSLVEIVNSEETIKWDSVPKAFATFVKALGNEPELQKILNPLKRVLETTIYQPALDDELDHIKVQKDYMALTKMNYPEMKVAIKKLNLKYKKFL